MAQIAEGCKIASGMGELCTKKLSYPGRHVLGKATARARGLLKAPIFPWEIFSNRTSKCCNHGGAIFFHHQGGTSTSQDQDVPAGYPLVSGGDQPTTPGAGYLDHNQVQC